MISDTPSTNIRQALKWSVRKQKSRPEQTIENCMDRCPYSSVYENHEVGLGRQSAFCLKAAVRSPHFAGGA